MFINKVQIGHKHDQIRKFKQVPQESTAGELIRIFPFKLVTGAFLTTNNGFKGLASYVNNYNDLALIFTGQEAITAEWRNSIKISQNIDKANPTDKTKNFVRRTKQVGTFFEGELLEHYQAQEVSIYAPNVDFQKLVISRVFKAKFRINRSNVNDFQTNNDIIENFIQYEFDFFVCPEIAKENENVTNFKSWPDNQSKNQKIIEWNHQLFRPISMDFYYDSDNLIHAVEIKFASVNDFMSNTGFAIQQYINFGAPGQGYAFPTIDPITKQVGIDASLVQNLPITHAQLDIYGTAALNSVVFFGYKSNESQNSDGTWNEDVFAPSEIYFTNEFQAPLYDNTKQKSLAESNFYLLKEANVDLISQYTKWSDIIASKLFSPLINKNYEGILSISEDPKSSNPISDQGSKYEFTIFDQNFLSEFSKDWTKYTNLFNDNVYFKNEKGQGLNDFEDFAAVQGYNVSNFLMRNHILNSQIHQVPISAKQAIQISENLNISLGSIVGKFVPFGGFFSSFFNQTVPLGFRLNKNIIKSEYSGFDYLMSAPIFDLQAGIFADQEHDKIFLDVFRYGGQDAIDALGGQNTTTTSLLSNLSNEILLQQYANSDNAKGELVQKESYFVGQNDGVNTFFYTPDSTVQTPTDPTQGYIIVGFQMKALAKSDFRLSFFSKPYSPGNEQSIENEDMTWMGYYKTKGSFSSNVMLWETTLTLGNPFYDNIQPFSFPENYNTAKGTQVIVAPDLSTFDSLIGINFPSFETSHLIESNDYNFVTLNSNSVSLDFRIPIDQTSINVNASFDNLTAIEIDSDFGYDNFQYTSSKSTASSGLNWKTTDGQINSGVFFNDGGARNFLLDVSQNVSGSTTIIKKIDNPKNLLSINNWTNISLRAADEDDQFQIFWNYFIEGSFNFSTSAVIDSSTKELVITITQKMNNITKNGRTYWAAFANSNILESPFTTEKITLFANSLNIKKPIKFIYEKP